MDTDIFSREELLKALSLKPGELDKWEQLGLIRLPGKIDNSTPYYTNSDIEDGRHIQHLLSMGYDLNGIQKIIRKVGLPSNSTKTRSSRNARKLLTVGELAKQTGLNARTIKYWEEREIIQPDGRSEGGFRLYSEHYIYLCNLIRDFQNFGYSLEEIKETADLFRDFITIQNGTAGYAKKVMNERLELMQSKITLLEERMKILKNGIGRWEDLIRKKKREINQLLNSNSSPKNKQANRKPKLATKPGN